MDQKRRITIEVSGGMVQNVYTTLETDVEVDVLVSTATTTSTKMIARKRKSI